MCMQRGQGRAGERRWEMGREILSHKLWHGERRTAHHLPWRGRSVVMMADGVEASAPLHYGASGTSISLLGALYVVICGSGWFAFARPPISEFEFGPLKFDSENSSNIEQCKYCGLFVQVYIWYVQYPR
ncbi:unnamed protein product [Sphagnum troendelagicum]|uniref:Uncharacterized protein n=1 Tax=Sphagnum troendelagicum TaxID=128251 RepID=A0ABP0U465_9BRYO